MGISEFLSVIWPFGLAARYRNLHANLRVLITKAKLYPDDARTINRMNITAHALQLFCERHGLPMPNEIGEALQIYRRRALGNFDRRFGMQPK